MKIKALFLALFMSLTAAADTSTLLGKWLFVGMIYQGNYMPPRDPKLILTFTFDDQGMNQLYWTFDDHKTFCDRSAEYTYENNVLSQEVVWVNPKNKSDCGADTDMQMGRKTESPLEVVDGKLHLHIPFSGSEIIYIFEPVTNSD